MSLKDSVNSLFKNKKFRILFGPAKGLTWINDLNPHLTFNLGLWESRKQILMKKYVTRGMVAYDLGAYHGYFTLVFSRLVGEKGLVYSFEPAKESFEHLGKLITFNRLNNVKLHQKAVGEKDRKGYFNFNNSYPMGSCVSDAPGGNYKVDIISLNSFVLKDLNKKPDIVKVDIEGFEFKALKGMDKIVDLYHPIFFIDAHGKKNHSCCITFLEEHGYKVEVLSEKLFKNEDFQSDLFALFKIS